MSHPAEDEKILLIFNIGYKNSLEKMYYYLSTGEAQAEIPEVRRYIKMKTRNFMLYDSEMYRRTMHGLNFIPKFEARMRIMKVIHEEVGHWDFRTTYAIISKRFWAYHETRRRALCT